MRQATSKVKVEMYSSGGCPYCDRARRLLNKKGVGFTEVRIDKEAGLREEMERRSHRQSVPQIFINDHHIGGFDDIAELDFDGELDKLLGLAKDL